MSEIRKYITLIESFERLDEGKRQDAIAAIENHSYQIGLHFLKLMYLIDHPAKNHWIVEIRTFLNDIIKKTKRAKIKQSDVYEYMSSIILSVQVRNKMIKEIHEDYEYVTIDLNDVYNFFNELSQELAKLVDNGARLEYHDIQCLI